MDALSSVGPAYLLLDYLLASSWTWLALCLATIATTLRAFRLRIARRRLLNLTSHAPSPASPTVSSSSTLPFKPQFLAANCALPCVSRRSSFLRRAKSNSTSSLEKLLHADADEILYAGVQFLSCVFDTDRRSTIKKISSALTLSNGERMHGRTHWNSELDAGFPSETKGYAYIHHLQAGRICSGKRRGSQTTYSSRVWLSVPSQTEAHKEAQETFQKALMDFQVLKDEGEHSHRWLPSWAVSLCAPSQLQRWPSAPQRFDPVFLSQSLYPCFERQFGWDELLRCKLGFPWTLIPRSGMGLTLQDDLPMGQSNVVRIWEGLPKKVLRKLNVDEGSTLAFDTCGNRGLAFTGNVEGELSIWDLERRLRASKFDFTEPLLAVSVNRDHSSAVVGSASGVGLWDARSPAYNFSQSNILPLSSVSALKSRGNGLCITIDDSTLSVYDVRMLHGLPLTSVMLPKMQKSPAASEDGPEILEKFTRCAEDDAEYDDLSWEIGAVDLQNASTWVSRLNTYVQTVVALVW